MVLKEIFNLNKDITIILITHRINTIKKCDNIIFIDRGELKGEGTFDKLSQLIEKFKETSDKLKMV